MVDRLKIPFPGYLGSTMALAPIPGLPTYNLDLNSPTWNGRFSAGYQSSLEMAPSKIFICA
jgi:hypothetical protein